MLAFRTTDLQCGAITTKIKSLALQSCLRFTAQLCMTLEKSLNFLGLRLSLK